MSIASKRMTVFLVLIVFYFIVSLLFLVTSINTWIAGSTITHSLIQSVATVLAFFCGTSALYRYYSGQSKSSMLLFAGVGFIATTLIDAYHTVVTASFFKAAYPLIPHSVAEWSWLSTRSFLALLFLMSLPGLFKQSPADGVSVKASKISPKVIYISVAILTILNFLFFVTVRSPYPIYPDHLIARPLEIVAGVIFLFALIGYLVKGDWKTERIAFWMVLFLITSVCEQFFYIGLSKHSMDAEYIGAHVMKIISYGMVYIAVSE